MATPRLLRCRACGIFQSRRRAPAVFCLPCSAKRARARGRVTAQVTAAIQRGDLIRPEKCEACGCAPTEKLHGHHDDYTKPLSVRWLCRSCHFNHHHELRRAGKPVPVSA
jgi:hypothetical protein